MSLHDARFSDEANAFAKENDELLGQVVLINECARDMLERIEVNPSNVQTVLAAALYSRFLSNCQAGFYLAEVGLDQQSEMMLRPTLESLFTLCAIAKSKEYVKKFVSFDEGARRDQAKRLLHYKERIGAPEDAEALKAKEVVESFEQRKLPNYNAKDAAEIGGLIDWYDTVYVATSDTLHSSVGSIEAHLDLMGEPPKLRSIQYGPRFEKAVVVVVTYCQCIEAAIAALQRLFGLESDEKITACSSRIRELYGNDS